jgi:hypothetical protein
MPLTQAGDAVSLISQTKSVIARLVRATHFRHRAKLGRPHKAGDDDLMVESAAEKINPRRNNICIPLFLSYSAKQIPERDQRSSSRAILQNFFQK